jgi:PKD repeat protein
MIGSLEGMQGCYGRPGRLMLGAVLVALASSAVAAPAALASKPISPAGTHYAVVRPACPPPTPGHATCFALVRVPVAADVAASVGAKPYVPGDGAYETGPKGGLTPADLASAYEYNPAASGGEGQTVAIVDAYDDPKIEADLGEFDTHYGLSECTSANGCFKKVGQTGGAPPAADTSGWSGEISLDVETVHGVCRKCKILLVEANEATSGDLATSVNEAVKLGATEVSNSYGGPEGGGEEAAYNHPGVVIAASAGDQGYYDWDYAEEEVPAPERPNTPAALPSVVSVGGTSLVLNTNGTRESETVWNDSGPPSGEEFPQGKQFSATGGGCSTLFTARAWQQAAAGWASTGCRTRRLDNDVAAVADPYTGFDVYDSYDCGAYCEARGEGKGWQTIGGTSLSSPLVTALYALAGGSGGVPYPAVTLYGHLGQAPSLYDVTAGGDGYCDAEQASLCGHPDAEYGVDVDCEGTTACDAAAGFDGPSGVGAPKGLGAFQPMYPTAAITPPGSPKAGVAAGFSAGSSSDPYPGATISSYSWNWGDGTAGSSGREPAHTFASPGTYTVTLTVTDDYGVKSTPDAQSVTVAEQTPAERKQHEEEAAKVKGEEEAAAASRREQEALSLKASLRATASSLAPSPYSNFTTRRVAVNRRNGVITFTEFVGYGGRFTWLATFQNGRFGVFAASACRAGDVVLKGKCRPAQIAFARGSDAVGSAGTLTITLRPGVSARKALKNALRAHRAVSVSVTLAFEASLGGSPVSHTRLVTVRLRAT